MSDDHKYEVNLQWKNERKGELTSPLLNQTIEVATPPDFPKGMPGIWSPEHLLIAAVNSCLMTTFLAIAENSKLDYDSFECNAIGWVEKVDGKFQVTKIVLKPKVTFPSHTSYDKVKRVLEMSEKNCLISNSIKSTVTLEFD